MLVFVIAQGIESGSDLFALICASCYLSLQHRRLRTGFVQPPQLKPAKCKHTPEQLETRRAKRNRADKANPTVTAKPEPFCCESLQEESRRWGWPRDVSPSPPPAPPPAGSCLPTALLRARTHQPAAVPESKSRVGSCGAWSNPTKPLGGQGGQWGPPGRAQWGGLAGTWPPRLLRAPSLPRWREGRANRSAHTARDRDVDVSPERQCPFCCPGHLPARVVTPRLPPGPCALPYLEPHFPRAERRQFQLTSVSSSAEKGTMGATSFPKYLWICWSTEASRGSGLVITIRSKDKRALHRSAAVPFWVGCSFSPPAGPATPTAAASWAGTVPAPAEPSLGPRRCASAAALSCSLGRAGRVLLGVETPAVRHFCQWH